VSAYYERRYYEKSPHASLTDKIKRPDSWEKQGRIYQLKERGPIMIYIGMDVSSKSFTVHAINERKKVVFKGDIKPTRAGLRGMIEGLGRETKLVVFEAGNQLKWIALTLKKIRGVQMHVVHPNEIKWINQSSGKTDKIDARKLAYLARGDMLPRQVHIVEGEVRELRELISARSTIQSKRIALINSIRGCLKQEGYKLAKGFFKNEKWREQLKKMRIGPTQKLILEKFMESIEGMVKAESELTAKILEVEHKDIELLETIPGIGGLTSRVLVSAIDDANRFANKKSVSKYGGLSPRIYQSGGVTHLGRINRDGRMEVRKVLLQCAHTITRMKSYEAWPLRRFFDRIRKRRGKKIAVVALARKLLTIAYGVLKTQRVYDPEMLYVQVGH
jgi:transposase